MLLAQLPNGRDGAPTEHAEVADFALDTLVDQFTHQPVKECRGRLLEHALTASGDALCRYDVVALLEQTDHFRQQLRRVLKVRVHYNGRVACREIETGSNCR